MEKGNNSMHKTPKVSLFINNTSMENSEEKFDIYRKVHLAKRKIKEDLFQGSFFDYQASESEKKGCRAFATF